MAEWWWWSGQQRWWKNPFQVNDKMVMTVYASLMLADCRPAWCWKRRSLTKTGWYSFGNKSKPFNGSSISSEYSQIYLTVFAILDRNGFRKYWGLLPRRIPPVFLCPHLGWNAVFSGTLPKIRTGESWAPQWSHGKGFMDTLNVATGKIQMMSGFRKYWRLLPKKNSLFSFVLIFGELLSSPSLLLRRRCVHGNPEPSNKDTFNDQV